MSMQSAGVRRDRRARWVRGAGCRRAAVAARRGAGPSWGWGACWRSSWQAAGAGAVYQALAGAADARAYPPPGRLVDVGGYRLHIACFGERHRARPRSCSRTGAPGSARSTGALSRRWSRRRPGCAPTTGPASAGATPAPPRARPGGSRPSCTRSCAAPARRGRTCWRGTRSAATSTGSTPAPTRARWLGWSWSTPRTRTNGATRPRRPALPHPASSSRCATAFSRRSACGGSPGRPGSRPTPCWPRSRPSGPGRPRRVLPHALLAARPGRDHPRGDRGGHRPGTGRPSAGRRPAAGRAHGRVRARGRGAARGLARPPARSRRALDEQTATRSWRRRST